MANIVKNPDFEMGLTNWTANSNVEINSNLRHSGSNNVQFVLNNAGAGILSQFLTTIPGKTYTLSYWLANNTPNVVGFSAFWNSTQIFPSTILTSMPFAYTQYSFNVNATNSSTILTFSGNVSNQGSSLGMVLDDISVVAQVICFSGESLVKTKNTITGSESEIKVKNLVSNIHQVYSVNDQKFIPVKYNMITGPVNHYMLIKKDALGENQPNEDFYITSGHKIVINGIETKARDIPQAIRINIEPEMVYSICTEKHEPILVNNLPVISWGHDEWFKNVVKKNISWKNNTL